MFIHDKEGLLDEVLTSPANFLNAFINPPQRQNMNQLHQRSVWQSLQPEQNPQFPIPSILSALPSEANEENLKLSIPSILGSRPSEAKQSKKKHVPSSLRLLLDQYNALALYTKLRAEHFKRSQGLVNPGFHGEKISFLSKLIKGKEHLHQKISPEAMNLLLAGKIQLDKLIQTIEIPWNVNNYVTLEPILQQILAEESLDKKVNQLLHLARLRGGIADLLEVVNLQISDDLEFGYLVVNALNHLKDECFRYQELVNQNERVLFSKPVRILHKLPPETKSFAWNGAHLFYVDQDEKTLVKCVGDIKRTDFGKKLSSVSYNFISEQRRNYYHGNQGSPVLITANATHIFCVDDLELHVFTEDMKLWKKVAFRRQQLFSSITCSNDGSVTAMSYNRGQFTRFWLNEASEYVSTDFNQTRQDVSKIPDNTNILIQENKKLLAVKDEASYMIFEMGSNGKLVLIGESNQANHQATDELYELSHSAKAYDPTTGKIMYLSPDQGAFILRNTSSLLKSSLQKTPYASPHFQDYLGFHVPVAENIKFKSLKAQVQELIEELQKIDLQRDPSEKALNYFVSQTKPIYEHILKTKNLRILELNLLLLERQGFSLNTITQSETFEMQLLETFKDDLEGFKSVWCFVGLQAVEQFRSKYPEYEYTQKSKEELIWEKLDLFSSQGQVPQDGESPIGDIIRMNIGERVTNQEFRDHQIFIETFKSEFNPSNLNVEKFDGLLSGGASSIIIEQQYGTVLDAIQKVDEKKSHLARLGGKNKKIFTEVTEKTFLAIVQLSGQTRQLQIAENTLAKVPVDELVLAYQMDVELNNFFSQLWLRASQIKSHLSQLINQLPGEPSQAQIDEKLAIIVAEISDKCAILQRCNVPFIIQNQTGESSQVLRVQSSFENDQLSNQLTSNYNLWKKKLLEKKEDLGAKAEAIAQSVLNILKGDVKPEDLRSYLEEAQLFAKQRLTGLKQLEEGIQGISQNNLSEFINFLVGFKLKQTKEKFSYVVKGVAYQDQSEIQTSMFKIIKKLHERCKSDSEMSEFLRLVRSLKFTARDFEPLHSQLKIFDLLNQIKDSDKTVQKLVGQILHRLDDEKEISDIGLSKGISRIDPTESNRLLSGQVQIFKTEMESFISIWQQIENQGPITKKNYKQIGGRITNELILQNLAQIYENATIDDLEKAKLGQQDQLQVASDKKYKELVALLSMISERFDKYPNLLRLFATPETLRTILSSLLILSENLSLQIVDFLLKLFTHSSNAPANLLDVSCSEVWPRIKGLFSCKDNFTSYLLGLATHRSQDEKKVQQPTSQNGPKCLNGHIMILTMVPIQSFSGFSSFITGPNLRCNKCRQSFQPALGYFNCGNNICDQYFCLECGTTYQMAIKAPIKQNIRKELLRLAAVQPSLNLLENFVDLPESSQFTILEMYQLSLEHRKGQQMKDDLLSAAQGLLNEKLSPKILVQVLRLLIKGGVRTLSQASIVFLASKSLFSYYQIMYLDEIQSQPKFLQNVQQVTSSLQQPPQQTGLFGQALSTDTIGQSTLFQRSLFEPQISTLSNQSSGPLFKIPETGLFPNNPELHLGQKSQQTPQIEVNLNPVNLVQKTLDSDPKMWTKQILGEQISQIVQFTSVPANLILQIFENIDESSAPKVQTFLTQLADSPTHLSKLQALLDELISSLTLEKVTQLKIQITKVLLEYEFSQQQDASSFAAPKQINIQVYSENPSKESWIEQLEELEIEDLSQYLLFRQLTDKPTEFSLFLTAKIYLDFVAAKCGSKIRQVSELAPKNFEQMYADLIMRVDENTAKLHIVKQASMPATSAEAKFRQLLLYAGLKSKIDNKPMLPGLQKLISVLLTQISSKPERKSDLQEYVDKYLDFLSVHRDEIEADQNSKSSIDKAVNPGNPLYKYYQLQLKFIFAHFDKKKFIFGNGFENWVSFMKDLVTRNFKKLFDQVFPESKMDQAGLKLLSKHYSSDFVHRVQNATRLRLGISISQEFQSDESSEQQIVAGYVQMIIQKFSSQTSWLSPEERRILVECPSESELQDLVLQSNSFILYDKQLFDYRLLPSRQDNYRPGIRVNRHAASQFKVSGKKDDGTVPDATLFTQLLLNIKQQGGFQIMCKDNPGDRAFQVEFVMEGASDSGGPYRELFDSICTELMSSVLPLLIPTPNQTGGLGDLRNCWMLNFEGQKEELFVFLGVILGYAIRTASPLLLELHPIVWKQINKTKLTLDDLKTSDLIRHQMLTVMSEIDRENFDLQVIDQYFTVDLPGGTQKELVENGANLKVTFDNVKNYVELARKYLLHIADKQAEWVRKGVEQICGKSNLAQLHWSILEERACGPPNIDISYLKANTQNQNVDPQTEKWFWEILEEFSQSERIKYLQFVSGRGKLPINMQRDQLKHVISPKSGGYGEENLPTSQTCYFTVKIPRYQSKEVFKRCLLIAINFCGTIDGDRDVYYN